MSNLSTSPTHLRWFGLEDEWERYTAAAMSLAVSTRDAFKPEAAVLAGFAAPGSVARDRSQTYAHAAGGEAEFIDECRAMGRLLAEAGADAVIVEIVRFVSDAVLAMTALEDLGVPVYLGLLADNDDGLSGGDSYEELIDALAGAPSPGAVLLHCGKLSAITAGLPQLAAGFDGLIGAYGNLGYHSGAFLEESERPNWFNLEGETPYSFARAALGWVDAGARMVGGCCATGPAHILMLQTLLSEQTQR